MDPNYIKMVRSAVEIQGGWWPKDGDMFLFEDKDTEESFIDYCPAYTSQKVETEEDKFHLNFYKENCIYLPRQEDLQKIYKEKKELSFDCCYVQFKRWDAFRYQHERFEHGLPYFEIFETGDWNVLWLCFVMETCYHKKWNMETQTWETTQ